MIEAYRDFFIFYNWLPLVADHCIDSSANFYAEAGVRRLHDKDYMNPKEVNKNDIVFVKVDEIMNGRFQNTIFPHIENEFTLVSGVGCLNVGSTGDTSHLRMLESPKLKYWFSTNPPKNINSPKLIPLPVGFGEQEREAANQNNLRYAWENQIPWDEKKDMLYLSYHTPGTNPKRASHISYLNTLDFVYVEEEKLPPVEYLKRMGEYKFIICLEGSGYDTHRNYESLLVGSVPIMINSTIKSLYERYNLVSLFVDDWKEITEDFFNSILESEYCFDTSSDFLRVGFHADRIREYAIK